MNTEQVVQGHPVYGPQSYVPYQTPVPNVVHIDNTRKEDKKSKFEDIKYGIIKYGLGGLSVILFILIIYIIGNLSSIHTLVKKIDTNISSINASIIEINTKAVTMRLNGSTSTIIPV